MSPTVCLTMIVRNEGAVIERAIASALPYISTWRIIDTGSTDDTMELVKRALAAVPGELRQSPWQDFATNRTELVNWARGAAEWLLLLDADMTVDADPDIRSRLETFTADAALVSVEGGVRYRMPYLARGSHPWRYVGRTHEYLSCENSFSSERFDALRLYHHADGGTRGEKFERDLRLLAQALTEQPDDVRTVFYLAQTHRDRGDLEEALAGYRHRVELGGWEEEVFYATYQAGLLEHKLDRVEATETLLTAWDLRPTRAEPLYHVARINRLRRRHHIAWIFANLAVSVPRPDDMLFVEDWVYDWAARFERADAAWRIGEHALAVELSNGLIAEGRLPDDHREHLEYVLREVAAASSQGASIEPSISPEGDDPHAESP